MERIYRELNQLLESPLGPEQESELFKYDLYFIKLFYNRQLLNRETFCQNAAVQGNFTALQWGARKGLPLNTSVWVHGLKHPHMSTWLVNRVDFPKVSQELMTQLINEGHLEAIKVVLEKSPVVWTDEMTAQALRLGKFDILKYIHELQLVQNFQTNVKREDSPSPKPASAIGGGDFVLPTVSGRGGSPLIGLNSIKSPTVGSGIALPPMELPKKEPEAQKPTDDLEKYYSSRPGLRAASESVKSWVRVHGNDPFLALKHGRIDVAEILNPTAYCVGPITCIDLAARGNLEVLKWLEKKRPDFPVSRVFRKACEHEHIDVLDWLVDDLKCEIVLPSEVKDIKPKTLEWLREKTRKVGPFYVNIRVMYG